MNDSPAQRTKFMLIAGEASGDTLGAELVKALRARQPNTDFFGAGGPRMAAEGVNLAFDLTTHAVVGIWEVLKNYGKFKGFFDQLLSLAITERPDAIILIDYPGFNLRFARAARKLARQSPDWRPKIIYYVSPQIWAWHESRIHQIAEDIDLMLAIFPFEKTWYASRKPGFKVEFVGHPLIDRYAGSQIRPAVERDPLVVLLPGSRVRELRKHLPVMSAACERIHQSHPDVQFQIVLPSENLEALARAECPNINVQVGGLAETLTRAQIAIASSGTVTMECAYFRVPTIVIYKTSWSTYLLARRFVRVSHVAMPNLLARKEIYPELIQEKATAANIAAAANELLSNSSRRQEVQRELQNVINTLGQEGAASRAALFILRLLHNKQMG